MTSRDMLKFGMLCHQKGKWGEDQILPEEWVKESITSHITKPDGDGYGYQFWIFNMNNLKKNIDLPVALGNGDQRIFIDNTNNLLVVTTAGNYNKWDIKKDSNAMLERIYKATGLLE